ncbi:hypothetical protein CNEO4_1470016 [Clostridium neonatale]|nr:hypothetical protein CNEO4_1470016 [Clostridium neonatale]CAI3648712.1 hypothetical protein CNEO4_410089 [Clostridium neonatale]CAI3699561.1 hypothetical protein CNEO3_840003 [Clostridium neonatale]
MGDVSFGVNNDYNSIISIFNIKLLCWKKSCTIADCCFS